MKYRICVDDKNFQVRLEDIFPDPDQEMMVESGYNRFPTKILQWSKELSISSILVDGVPYDVEILLNARGQMNAVKIDNEIFRIDEIQVGKLLTTRTEFQVIKEGVVKAFMPGLIVRTLKNVGDTVEEGETILYLEAMKMENAITAPRSGTLSRLEPKEGDTVMTNDLLFVVD